MLVTPSRSKTLQCAVEGYRDPFAVRWRDLWWHERLAVSFEASRAHGGLAFTLNLNERVRTILESRYDPADFLRRRINRELRAAIGELPAYSFAFEVSPGLGRLHVHGTLIPLSADPAHLKAIREALARAGGKMTGRGAARQVDTLPATDGLGWAAYTLKAFDDACNITGTHKVTFVSDKLTALAQTYHRQLGQK